MRRWVGAALWTMLLAGGAAADDVPDPRWSVLETAGPVKVSSRGQWRALGSDRVVAQGAWLKTGTRGRVVLERDGVRIEVRPGSLVAVAGLADDPGMTVLMQRWGETALDVEPRARPRVKVHTPFMASVVKGTRFEVSVDRCYTAMRVVEGRIAVEDAPRGQATEIVSGQSAGAGRGPANGMRVEGAGARAPVTTIPKASGAVPGLARNEVVTPQNVFEPAMRLPRRPS